jgi:hypothetical protein
MFSNIVRSCEVVRSQQKEFSGTLVTGTGHRNGGSKGLRCKLHQARKEKEQGLDKESSKHSV